MVRPLVPAGLTVQTFAGSAWVGLVPFRMAGVTRRPLPALPWLSAFPEVNLRTYVEMDGRPGVWFFSLDASNPVAVWAASRFFHLPYFKASMNLDRADAGIRFTSRRAGNGPEFVATYGPTGDVYRAAPGSLEHWLTERYCLYASDRQGSLLRTEVHHRQWPLQPASCRIETNTLGLPHGLMLAGEPALVHFSAGVDVVAWRPVRVSPPVA